MITLGKKLSSSVCKICTCSIKASLLQVSDRCLTSHSSISCVSIYRKSTLLVPVQWWKGHQKGLSCTTSFGACDRRSKAKSALFFQLRKKNVLAQPIDLKAKITVNKASEASNTSCEGPVLHHSAAAALVLTKQQNEQQTEERSHCGKPAASEENSNMSEQSTEKLLSCTTAYVRRISSSNEWDLHEYYSNDRSPDIEYVVEQRSALSAKPVVRLSGALAASARDWRSMEWKLADLPSIYAALAKSRLTGLVVATALGGYVLAPAPLSLVTLVGAVAGTGLVSAAANTTNQVLEVPYDAQMSRTANRALVRGVVSPLHAVCFASTCGVGGLTLLLGMCGPAAAGLGLLNLTLYTALYTPLKRCTIANTWVGALVGAIPPLIGWCGCGGPLIGADAWGAWLMAGLLFAWQFPHFNALSWNLRADYSKAGYRMMCVTDPRLCRVTCVRYSAALLLLSFAAPALSVTTWTFAADSAPLNAYMLYLSYRFYRDGDSRSARNLFRYSLLHLPAVIVLLLISKKWNTSAAKEEVPAQYISSVVYNKNFTAQTVPTIVAAATETGSRCPEIDSKILDVLSMKSASGGHKIGENTTREVGVSVSLNTKLEQGSASSTLLKESLISSEVADTVVQYASSVGESGSEAINTRENNGKTSLNISVAEVSR